MKFVRIFFSNKKMAPMSLWFSQRIHLKSRCQNWFYHYRDASSKYPGPVWSQTSSVTAVGPSKFQNGSLASKMNRTAYYTKRIHQDSRCQNWLYRYRHASSKYPAPLWSQTSSVTAVGPSKFQNGSLASKKDRRQRDQMAFSSSNLHYRWQRNPRIPQWFLWWRWCPQFFCCRGG